MTTKLPPERPEDLEFIQGLRRTIEVPSPLALLEAASMVLAATEYSSIEQMMGREAPRASRDDLVASFCEARLPETDALLRAWCGLIDDDAIRGRILRNVNARNLPVPQWLHRIDEVRPVRAVSVMDVFGENETIFIEISTPVDSFTLVVAIFHNGPLVEDAYAIPLSFAGALAEIGNHDELDIVRTELSLANTRARIVSALEITRHTYPPVETESWPATGPLLDWMLRLMPADGSGYEYAEWSPERINKLVNELAASPFGSRLSHDELDHARCLFELHTNYGTGNPLLWGGMFVIRVLSDLYPRKVMAPHSYMRSMPTALRAVVQFANNRSDISDEATDDVLDTIRDFEGEYIVSIASGADAEFGDYGPFYDDDFENDGFEDNNFEFFGGLSPFSREEAPKFWLHLLSKRVGGIEALDNLDDAPLPVEPANSELFAGIREDILPRVQRIAALTTEAAEKYFDDAEMTTVALRVIARVARGNPTIFSRPSKDENTAGAVCWIAGKNNDWFYNADPSRTVKTLMQQMGLKTSPQQRAHTMLNALNPVSMPNYSDLALSDPNLLTSTNRKEIIELRDRFRAELRR